MFAPTNMLELLSALSKSWNMKKSDTKIRIKSKSSILKRTRPPYRHIQRIKNQILEYICIHPGSTAYDIRKERALYLGGAIEDYRLIRRCIKDLCEKGLIERQQRKPFEYNAKPCRLTINGIFHLIIERKMMGWHIYKGIFENYGTNILFDSCLYPYVNRYTVTHLTENAVLTVCLFLQECCKIIENAIESVNTTKYKHVMRHVFIWEEVPRDKNQTADLREFLKQKFDLKWLDNASFEKLNNDNTLRISYRSNSVLITLNKTRTKAVVEIKGERKGKGYEFIVKQGPNGSLNIMALDKPIVEFEAESLQAAIKQRIPTLIFDLAVNVTSESDYSVLSKDEKFMQRLSQTKVKFDEQYEKMVMRTQLTAL
jgi:hypothetical protein